MAILTPEQRAALMLMGDRTVAPGYYYLHKMLGSYYEGRIELENYPKWMTHEEAVRRFMTFNCRQVTGDWGYGMSNGLGQLMRRGY